MRRKIEYPHADEVSVSGTHFERPPVRYEKGSGLEIIAAELDRRVEKTNRLKAARQAQEVVQAGIDAETLRNALPAPLKARRSRAKKPIAG